MREIEELSDQFPKPTNGPYVGTQGITIQGALKGNFVAKKGQKAQYAKGGGKTRMRQAPEAERRKKEAKTLDA